MGLVQVNGAVELNQFFPAGRSDADTTNVRVRVDPTSFRYVEALGAAPINLPWMTTARVRGEGTHDVLSHIKGRGGRPPGDYMRVRLESVDAPELHFRPRNPLRTPTKTQREAFKRFNEEYRQWCAEMAVFRLVEHLDDLATNGAVSCLVETEVEAPNEIFDAYGRFVGIIQLHSTEGPQTLNDWLLDRGLALPAFYSSARIDEIDRLTTIAADASRKDRGIWDVYRNQIEAFDPVLRFRKLTDFTRADAAKDRQRFTTPKLFRRQAAWEAALLAKLPVAKTLPEFLGSGTGNEYVTLDDFRLQGLEAAPTHFLGDLIRPTGRLRLRPEQIIFKEKPSTLVDQEGRLIVGW
jgi:endonuclease YncB( thermonuclease family)